MCRMAEGSKKRDSNIDGGYAWVILFGSFMTVMLCIGSIKAYGILYTEMVDYYASGTGKASWIGSVYFSSIYIIGPMANFFGMKYTFRAVCFTGGVLTAIGFFLSGFVERIEYMYITFLFSGLGIGISSITAITIISFYFEKHRTLANGIVMAGSGVGAIPLSFLYKFLIDLYSLRGAFWVISGCMANICVASCLFRQPKLLLDEKRITRYNEEQTTQLHDNKQRQQQKLCKGVDFNFSLFKNPLYMIYFLAFIFCMSGFTGNIILIPAHVKSLGYDKTKVALAVTIMGGCEIVGRILTGWFADLNIVRRKYIFSVNMFLGAVIAFVAPLLDTFTFMALYAAIVGLFPGTFWTLMADLLIEVVGLEKFAPAFGFVYMGIGIGSCLCMPVVGWLQDIYGNWTPSFILTGCLHILAGSMILFETVIVRCQWKACKDKEHNSPCNTSRAKSTGKDVALSSSVSTKRDYL